MGADTAIAIVSMGLAVLALAAAVAQVNIQASIEARRKGKTDKLALGDWAMTWPQGRLLICQILGFFFLKSPFGDPRILTVPFITLGALEDCLRKESQVLGRRSLQRRMVTRLVESASQSIATGAGRFTGRMYAVRSTTRKRSEACWSDAMDMCGITRRFWPLLTGASAQACDGAIRPANAVTNLHSLLGFARAMGLRMIERQGTRITMTNGGASIYLDQYAGVDRPTRLAHFSGSPNGRYRIIEEMSQQTAESIYADAVWSDGCVPISSRLEILPGSNNKTKEIGRRRIVWPESIKPPNIQRNNPQSKDVFNTWASDFINNARKATNGSGHAVIELSRFIESYESAVASCIRTYPKNELSLQQNMVCNTALLWCVQHWWLDTYQQDQLRYSAHGSPRIPIPDISIISCEFVTGLAQAEAWCRAVSSHESVHVDPECWSNCLRYATSLVEPDLNGQKPNLQFHDHSVLVKVLQAWKLNSICARARAGKERTDDEESVGVCEVMLLTMALLAIAMDSSQVGSKEANKELEIELGQIASPKGHSRGYKTA